MSLALRPLLANLDMSVSRSAKNDGRSLNASDGLAVVESLLPSFTAQEGPPTYIFSEQHQLYQ